MRPCYYLSPLMLLAGLGACTGTQTKTENNNPNSTRTESTRAATLDVPLLIGHTIDQVRRSLGPPKETKDQEIGIEPTSEQMQKTNGEDWVNTFERNGLTIVVTFNARTRKVRDLVLIGSDEDQLLRAGNLSLTDPDYIILPVAHPESSQAILGVRIVARK